VKLLSESRASFRKPPEVKLLSESRRTRFFQNKFIKPKEKVASFGNLWRFLGKARPPPEVKLLPFLREGRPPELLSERASFASFGKRGTYVLKRNGDSGKRTS
jgi:hypothetical protein